MGKGSSRVLGVASPDPVLAAISPLALGLAAGTALVVDLPASGRRTLSDLVNDGPALEELAPGRAGVAVIGGGGVDIGLAEELIDRLALNWPAVVVRVGEHSWPGPTVPVIPLLPGRLAPTDPAAAVWQPISSSGKPPGPGPVLPRLSRSTISALVRGRAPVQRRWVNAWGRVWGLPWA